MRVVAAHVSGCYLHVDDLVSDQRLQEDAHLRNRTGGGGEGKHTEEAVRRRATDMDVEVCVACAHTCVRVCLCEPCASCGAGNAGQSDARAARADSACTGP